ncbi:MAG: BACON domain-containing protein [Bryobacteraceae bacterium]
MGFRGAIIALFFCLSAHGQTCAFVTLSSSAAFASAGSSNGSFNITGTPARCLKSASEDLTWISLASIGGTAEPVTILYTVQANPSPNQRVGTISVNSGLATFTVTQSGIACTYSVSPETATVTAEGGTGSATVMTTSECSWTPVSSVPWITVTSGGGQGNGTLSYSVQPNTTKETRTGIITVGGDSLSVTQQPVCSFTLIPAFQQIRSSAESGNLTVTANASSCVRDAVSDSSWLTIPVGSTGTGNGTISWSAAANGTPSSRTGRITVGDATFSVQQEGGNCTYSLSPSSQRVTALGGAGTFTVTTACQWTAQSTASWLVFTSASTGTGTGTLSFRADPNVSSVERTGSITVGGTAFLVTQDAAGCSLNISSSSLDVPAAGGTGSFEVDVVTGCNWTAVSNASWLTITSAASGGGDATLSFAAAPNTTPGSRTGIISLGSRQFTVTQPGANCELSINPTANTGVPSNAFQSSIAVTSTCQWTAQSTVSWIAITAGTSGTGNGQIDYSIPANPSAQNRSGAIRIGNLTFNVTQTGGGCSLSLNPQRATLGGGNVSGRFSVNGSLGCQWTPSSTDLWISISGFSSVNGSGAVDFTLTPNFTGAERTGSVRIAADVSFTVVQSLAKPAIVTGGILNAASFKGGPVAPGEIVTIYGTLMGPAEIKTLELTADRLGITDTLAGTRVFFDGQPAPLIYTTDKQLSAIVPFEAQGRTSTRVKVEYQNAPSDEVEIAVAPTSPAVFTQNASGTGLGAILNQDNSLNGTTNGAQRNSILQIFATGGGQTNPVGETGKLAGTPLPQFPAGRVTVRINNIDAPVVYSGAAPGLIQGLIQINARVPATAPIGNAVPIIVRINNVDSPAGVTVAIRQ